MIEWFVLYYLCGLFLAMACLMFVQFFAEGSTDKEAIEMAVVIIIAWPLILGALIALGMTHLVAGKRKGERS